MSATLAVAVEIVATCHSATASTAQKTVYLSLIRQMQAKLLNFAAVAAQELLRYVTAVTITKLSYTLESLV